MYTIHTYKIYVHHTYTLCIFMSMCTNPITLQTTQKTREIQNPPATRHISQYTGKLSFAPCDLAMPTRCLQLSKEC